MGNQHTTQHQHQAIMHPSFNHLTFIASQLNRWPLAKANHHDVAHVQTRKLIINNSVITLQHNPVRAISSGSKVDTKSIASRQCFLCQNNRPQEQIQESFGQFHILINPYPILPNHLVLAHHAHTPQRISPHLTEMIEIAHFLKGFTVFYNGPQCGASAPDHMHFQAIPSDLLPIWNENYDFIGTIRINNSDSSMLYTSMLDIIHMLPQKSDSPEPMVNIFMRHINNEYQAIIIARRRHRPHNFSFDINGNEGVFISPGAIDVSGILVTPRLYDFNNLTPDVVYNIYKDVCYTQYELKQLIK